MEAMGDKPGAGDVDDIDLSRYKLGNSFSGYQLSVCISWRLKCGGLFGLAAAWQSMKVFSDDGQIGFIKRRIEMGFSVRDFPWWCGTAKCTFSECWKGPYHVGCWR
jgi:hypothetical protein